VSSYTCNCQSVTVEQPFDVALKDVGDLLWCALDSQQTSTYCSGTATSNPLYPTQDPSIFQRLQNPFNLSVTNWHRPPVAEAHITQHQLYTKHHNDIILSCECSTAHSYRMTWTLNTLKCRHSRMNSITRTDRFSNKE